ncbi:hypothetical protein K0M31_016466, partial [Melipona bicolor]
MFDEGQVGEEKNSVEDREERRCGEKTNRNPGPIRHLFMRPRVVFIKRAKEKRGRGKENKEEETRREGDPPNSKEAIVDTRRAYKDR